MERHSFPRVFDRRENFFVWGAFYEEFERCKLGPVTGSSLHRGPVGEPRGDSFTGTFEGKKKRHIWVPFL